MLFYIVLECVKFASNEETKMLELKPPQVILHVYTRKKKKQIQRRESASTQRSFKKVRTDYYIN